MEKAKVVELVSSLVKEGRFGGVGELVSLEPEKGAAIGAQFASQLSLLELTVRRPSGQADVLPIVVKRQFSDPGVRLEDFVANFNNEVVMYKDILPALNVNNIKRYPKVYYCYSKGGNEVSKDIIIMENLKTAGFTLSKYKVFLDFDHVSIALKAIGQFHSWSYRYKSLNKDKFIECQRKLVERKKFDDVTQTIIFECMKRGIMLLLEKGIETNVLEKFLKYIKNVYDGMAFLWKPDEVFGVIIHGDYNNNNIFVKYNEQGKPIDIALFDFQFTKYSSPVIDLAFFLYMNTEKDLREKHWDDFLQIYWDAVKENTPEEVVLPTYEEFLKHFASRVAYGYFPCSFFLPMMLTENCLSAEEFKVLKDEERINYHLKLVDDYIQYNIDVLTHMLEHKYIQSFINLYDEQFSI